MNDIEKFFSNLLIVIIILCTVIMIGIPALTKKKDVSRRDNFIELAKSYGEAAKVLWEKGSLTCDGSVSSTVPDGDYYILINSKESAKDRVPVLLEKNRKSSWNNYDVNGYVRVNVSTTLGIDSNSDGVFEVEPEIITKFYVALSDGIHGLVDDNMVIMDELKNENVVMKLTDDQLKKIELTVDDGKLDCARNENGVYFCAEVMPIKNITGICVDSMTTVELTGNGSNGPVSFMNDDWNTIITAIRSGIHPYNVGDTKEIELENLGCYSVRLANLSTPSECNTPGFSQTACGIVLEFENVISTTLIKYVPEQMNYDSTNIGSWPATKIREFLNNDIYDLFPSDLKSKIINTTVVSGHGSNESSNFTSIDKLYLLSTKEIWNNGSADIIDVDSARDVTRQLDYYKEKNVTTDNYAAAIKQKRGFGIWWWLRSPNSHSSSDFIYVSEVGSWGSDVASFTNSISPAFRIG